MNKHTIGSAKINHVEFECGTTALFINGIRIQTLKSNQDGCLISVGEATALAINSKMEKMSVREPFMDHAWADIAKPAEATPFGEVDFSEALADFNAVSANHQETIAALAKNCRLIVSQIRAGRLGSSHNENGGAFMDLP